MFCRAAELGSSRIYVLSKLIFYYILYHVLNLKKYPKSVYRRWPNIKPALGQRLVFAGLSLYI